MSDIIKILLLRYEGSSVLNVSEPHHSSEMDEQIMRIKVITNKLLDAYMGRDVSWIDEGKTIIVWCQMRKVMWSRNGR